MKATAGQSITLSIAPIMKTTSVIAVFNGKTVTFTFNKAKTLATYTLTMPAVSGKYTVTSTSAAFPLLIDVTGGIKTVPKDLPKVSWWGNITSWFGK